MAKAKRSKNFYLVALRADLFCLDTSRCRAQYDEGEADSRLIRSRFVQRIAIEVMAVVLWIIFV